VYNVKDATCRKLCKILDIASTQQKTNEKGKKEKKKTMAVKLLQALMKDNTAISLSGLHLIKNPKRDILLVQSTK
jgi:hypothetical protein